MNDLSITRGERTRVEIVEAAYCLFLEQGYHGTSMRQIAQEAGIAVGGIYNHFSSKEEIYLAVLRDHHPYHEVLPAMNAAEGETLEAFVRDAAMRMVAMLDRRKDFLNVMFIELVEFNGQHISYLFDLIYPQLIAFSGRFMQDQDRLRPVPTPVLVRAFIGLFFSYIITDLLIGTQMPQEMQVNALDHFIDIYLHGILIDTGKPGA
ncbi:MAG TPA: TetR/AcrR family transcriptional regulator [Anaerolineales bacterium]|nr:TetR/AcrR family transcriptional regulator [Anaerolineales bacterium]